MPDVTHYSFSCCCCRCLCRPCCCVAACPPGKALNLALDACSIKCSKGTFQDGTFLACIPCPQGQTSEPRGDEGATSCSFEKCPAGFGSVETNCSTPCAGGMYNDGTMTSCQQCAGGRTSKDGKRCLFETCPQGRPKPTNVCVLGSHIRGGLLKHWMLVAASYAAVALACVTVHSALAGSCSRAAECWEQKCCYLPCLHAKPAGLLVLHCFVTCCRYGWRQL
jgi:hypothetical protein